jgi:hypothetical protein
MGPDRDEVLVRDLAEPLVAELSPAEDGELFKLLSDAHFAAPEAYAHASAKASPLSFGLPEAAVLLTPVVLAALTQVLAHIGQTAAVKGYRVTARAIRRLFGLPNGDSDEEVLTLTAQEWTRIREIVIEVAGRGGIDAAQAEVIADAVVGRGMHGGPHDES